MSLFQELKRRNVIRVAILYLVSSWVLLQLADVLTSLLNAPEAAGSIVKTGDVHEIKSANGGKTRITATANEDGRIVTDTDGL